MDEIETFVRRARAEAAIVRLKSEYARFADAGYDPDGLARLFVDEGVWDGGELFGRAEGAEGIRRHFAGAASRIPWALHYVLNPVIDIDDAGDTATGSWYLWQPCVRRRSAGLQASWLAGTYADRYRLTPQGWRFVHVEVRARWLEAPPAQLTPFGADGG